MTRAPMYQITAPHFCAGFVLGEYYAPIIKYMAGWTLPAVERYCAKKGWRLELVP